MAVDDKNEQINASHALQWIINLAELHATGALTVQQGISVLYDDAYAFLRGEKSKWHFLQNASTITRPGLRDFEIFGTNKDIHNYLRFEIATIIENYDRCAQGNSPLKISAETLLMSEPSADAINGFLKKLAPESPALALGLAAEVSPLYGDISAPKITLDADRVFFMSGTDYKTKDELKRLSKEPHNKTRFDMTEEALRLFKKESKQKILRSQAGSDRKAVALTPRA